MAKTTTDLLTNVKRRAQLPDDSGTLSDSDILAFATDELQNVVAPRLMSINEWHYAYSYSVTLSSARNYRISSRTAGNTIISVEYYDGINYRFIQSRHPLMQTNPSVAGENYALYGNNIVLSDGCPTSGTLRVRALLRPSVLSSTGSFQITNGNPGALQVTISDTSSFLAGDLIDIVYRTSPYELYATGSVSFVTSSTRLDLTLPSDITVSQFYTDCVSLGLQISAAETSTRIMLPDELHDYLCQRVALRCVEARGLKSDIDNHMQKLRDIESAFDKLTAPRSKGEFKAILPEDFFFAGRP